MMTQTKRNSILGDAAVDGLLAGLGAGAAMGAYLILISLLSGEGFGEVLTRFAPGTPTSGTVGALSHMAVSGIYGAVFGGIMVLLPKRIPAWLGGLVYGLVLFWVARYVLLPGTGSSLLEISPVHFGIAHLLYGVLLGWQVGRK